MRKKELFRFSEELLVKNQQLLAENQKLQREVESLEAEIKKLREETEKLTAKLNATAPLRALEDKITSRAAVSKETEYGAAVIGKIVVKAAKCCNALTADTGGETVKELVNLILGRTEVAKAEILKAISADGSFEDKKAAIDSQQKSSEDYFDSIMAQIQ